MTGIEALQALREGKKVRRTNWFLEGYYFTLVTASSCITKSYIIMNDGSRSDSECLDEDEFGNEFVLDEHNANAGYFLNDDWEVVE